MNNILSSLLIGAVVAIVLSVTRSREDADKPPGSYIVKVMIVVCPIIFLSLTVLSKNEFLSGGGGVGGAMSSIGPGIQMHTGVPDF